MAVFVLLTYVPGMALRRTWQRRLALAALGVSALIAVMVAVGLKPAINDITTDFDTPPAFQAIAKLSVHEGSDLSYPARFAAKQREAYPGVQPQILPRSPGRVFELALGTARDLGWEIIAADREEGRIEATDTTRWLRFVDDVVIRIRPLEPQDGRTLVDVRSRSRVGKGDLGTNARRIKAFCERLRALADAS